MSTNPFKSLTAYRLIDSDYLFMLLDSHLNGDAVSLEKYEAKDPTGGRWSAAGLHSVEGPNDWVHGLDGAGHLMAVRFNERMLPAKVRDERLKTLVADLQDRQGHKVSKKDYAQLRDQAEFELLPQAFIKRTTVFVMFHAQNDLMLVFSSSAKRATDTVAMLRGVFSDEYLKFVPITTRLEPVNVLTNVATGYHEADDLADMAFEADDTAVLKGEGKRTIRVKDRDISGSDVQALLKAGYRVHDLGLAVTRGIDDEPSIYLKLNDNLIFRSIQFSDLKLGEAKGEDGKLEFHAHAWLVAKTFGSLVKETIDLMGGYGGEDAAVDDDEL